MYTFSKATKHPLFLFLLALIPATGFCEDWRQDFSSMPDDWEVQGKPFTAKAKFSIEEDPSGTNAWLNMTADKATATFRMKKPLPIDLNKTPIVRWRWRVTTYPTGGDSRNPKTDDQAIGLYFSTGSTFSQKSVAYLWETDTPVGLIGTSVYARVVTVQWHSLRNEESSKPDLFYIEERNLAEDFKAAFDMVPDKLGLGVSCNSQYTGTKAAAQLDWIEFLPAQPSDHPGEPQP
jgi:hypothetical protein